MQSMTVLTSDPFHKCESTPYTAWSAGNPEAEWYRDLGNNQT